MNGALSATLERVRQDRTERLRIANETLVKTAQVTRQGGRMFLAGDRVFDTVAGAEGEVVHAARENVVVPTPE